MARVILLLTVTAAWVATAHWPVLRAQAHALDDNLFVTNNTLVIHPSWHNAGRFFGEVLAPSSVGGYYLPLTMTSLMIDCAIGGRPSDYAVFHRTNLLLHVLNVIQMGLILYLLFGRALPAALGALVFGLHPLTVEPVAWISERKTLLATCFALASAWCYLVHVRRRGAWLPVSVLCYLLALLSKPSVTALPLMLLVLDAWPLRRLDMKALIEKWPFYVLTLGSVAVTVVSQVRTAPLVPLANAGIARSFLQVCYLIVFYLRKILWPVDLAPMYEPPHAFTFADPGIAASVVATGALVVASILATKRAPAVATAALLFLLALSPTFLILKWSHVIAYDRYLYFPALGLVVGAGYAMGRAAACGPRTSAWLVVAVLLVAGALTAATRSALANWHDSVALWRHVVKVSPGEIDAHAELAAALEGEGDLDAAAREYRSILGHAPDFGPALINLGRLELSRGHAEGAVELFRHVCRLSPQDPNFAHQLGLSEKSAGHLDQAEAAFRRVIELRPDDIPARVQLGTIMAMRGEPDAGMELVRRAMAMAPSDPNPPFGLAMIQLQAHGASAEALDHLARAVHLAPEWPLPAVALAWIRATSPDSAYRDGRVALDLAGRADELTHHRDPNVVDTYAAALASLGRFDQAAASARLAADLATRAGDSTLADSVRVRLKLYRRHVAYFDRTLAR